MKKRSAANLLMAVIILGIVAAGLLIAWKLKPVQESLYGSLYARRELSGAAVSVSGTAAGSCRVQIVCHTVFDNEEKLDSAKAPYLPPDGVILPATTVEFSEGETVFDVLRRACEAAELAVEYSWSPIYDSYYVEGINHLYEFDCGVESGWMYQVNGSFPNYGCSAYELSGGEEIVWCYTCVGLGTDVGAQRVGSQ